MKDIDSSESIVVFFDVLGYSNWVRDAKSPAEIKRVFDKIIKNIESQKSKYYQALEFFSYIDFTIWSDSLIYILDLKNIEDIEKRKRITSWLFYFLSLSIVEFIADTGYFLRGGISYGNFLQEVSGPKMEHRFIFSPAYIDAVELEKEAGNPRILMNKQFVAKEQLFDNWARTAIKQDIYGLYYLDYYSYLYLLPPSVTESYLRPIKELLVVKYPDIKDDERKRNKFCYFADYHNRHLSNMFRAKLIDEDFENPKMEKYHIVTALRDVGIVEDNADFFIKKEIKPSLPEIARTLSHVFPSTDGHLALLIAERIRRRIEEANAKVTAYTINYP